MIARTISSLLVPGISTLQKRDCVPLQDLPTGGVKKCAWRLYFLTEPQFWVNLNKLQAVDDKFKLSVGSELKLSHNFSGRDGFYAIPTLAVKWTFD